MKLSLNVWMTAFDICSVIMKLGQFIANWNIILEHARNLFL